MVVTTGWVVDGGVTVCEPPFDDDELTPAGNPSSGSVASSKAHVAIARIDDDQAPRVLKPALHALYLTYSQRAMAGFRRAAPATTPGSPGTRGRV